MYKTTAKAVAGLLILGVLCCTAESSTLRVESMGGVSICTRDVNGDPLTFNPARAAIIRQPVIVGGLGYTPYCDTYNEKTSTPRYGSVTGDLQESRRKMHMLDLDLLGYYPLRKTSTAGIYTRCGYMSDDFKMNTRYFGKVGTNIVYSTCTADTRQESINSSRSLRIGAIGGMIIGKVYTGLQYEKLVPNTQAWQSSTAMTDRGFYGQGVNETSFNYREDIQYFGDTFKGGALFLPFRNTSVDFTVSPSVMIEESRVTDEWTDGLQTWQDNRDAFPITTQRTSSTDWQAVLRHTTDDSLVYGLQLGYTAASINNELKRGSYTYTYNSQDNQTFKAAAGLGFEMDQTFTSEVDLEYSRTLNTSDNFAWAGNSSEKNNTVDSTNDTLLVRMGFEKWLFNYTFALRAGGGKYFYNYSNMTNFDLTSSRTISNDTLTANANNSFYSFGFGWVLSKSILLEYGARGNMLLDHKATVTYTF